MSEHEFQSNLPDVRGVYKRDYARHPRMKDDKGKDTLIEVDSIIAFCDGEVMLFCTDASGRPMEGIRLTPDAVWALKARA